MATNKDKILCSIEERAHMVHEEVNQKYDNHPYSYHLNMVAERTDANLKKLGYCSIDDELYVAIMFGAYFHDSIEDARLTYNDVKKIAMEYMDEMHATVATEIVYALTNEKGRNRGERANDKYYKGICDTPYANIVKYSDREANMAYSKHTGSKMYGTYVTENEHFMVELGFTEAERVMLGIV